MTTACPALLNDGPLACTRPADDGHTTGHVFITGSGIPHAPKEEA
jgi:hypothetical protein